MIGKLNKKQRCIRLEHYSYTYVRTLVMKSLLFKREDYHKMLKMSFSEIAKFLQDSNYRKEISALATEHSGPDILELALNRNLAESFKKLLRISSRELDLVIMAYARRKDVEDIKTILRGKFTKADERTILNSLVGAGTLSRGFLASLTKKDSIEEILKNNRLMDFSLFGPGLRDFNEGKGVISIENTLDKQYYHYLTEFSNSFKREKTFFREFLVKEVNILNILTIMRFKKHNFKKEVVSKFIIPSHDLMDFKLAKLAELDDLGDISKALERTEYGDIVKRGIEDYRKTNSLIVLETELYKYLLKESTHMLHKHPLSVDVILGYMLAKDIEVRNLKLIIKGKQLGLEQDFIESQIVF
jgi:V/A-type H+/Na+-transporting ATPase subunit C